jgi:hypothetical protein
MRMETRRRRSILHQVCKLTFLKVDENGDSIDDKEYEYTGDHSGFCEGIDEDYLEEVKEKAK